MGLLAALFRAATPENPSFGLSDPRAWDDLLGGGASSSGLRVTAESALSCGPWWRGVNLLSTDTARLPLQVLKRSGTAKAAALEHPAYHLVRHKPNPYQTAFSFKRQLTVHAISTKGGFAHVERDGAARPVALWPLDPNKVHPELVGGQPYYVVDVGSGKTRRLHGDDVLHVKGLSWDGLCGLDAVMHARETLGLALAEQRFAAAQFRNAARPAMLLEAPQKLSPEAKSQLRESFERMHTGLDNAHRTAVLDMGLQAKPVSFSNKDACLIESRQLSARDVSNFLGIPPHKLGDSENVSYASLEQQNLDYVTQALDHWLVAWEDEVWDTLLTEDEKRSGDWTVEFDRRGILKADKFAMSAYYRTALGGAAWLTPNEVRGEEGRDPHPDPEADEVPKVPGAGDAGETPGPPPGKGGGR